MTPAKGPAPECHRLPSCEPRVVCVDEEGGESGKSDQDDPDEDTVAPMNGKDAVAKQDCDSRQGEDEPGDDIQKIRIAAIRKIGNRQHGSRGDCRAEGDAGRSLSVAVHVLEGVSVHGGGLKGPGPSSPIDAFRAQIVASF